MGHSRSIGRGGKPVAKSYAVGLEISCPGGVHYWAPEIPSRKRLAGAKPSTCELVHNRGSFSPKCRLWPRAPGASSASFILRERPGGTDQQILADRSPRRDPAWSSLMRAIGDAHNRLQSPSPSKSAPSSYSLRWRHLPLSLHASGGFVDGPTN